MWKLLSGVIIVFSVTSWAADAGKTPDVYMQEAAAARERGDWDAARKVYSRLLADTASTQVSPRFQAVLHYEYGRSLGVTCFFKEAEHELTVAHDLDKNDREKQTGGIFYLSLVQLGRLNVAQRKFPEAVSYFEQILRRLDPVIGANRTPYFYSDLLDDYAAALSGMGRSGEADAASKRASEIRSKIVAAPSLMVDQTPYGTRCAPNPK